MNFLGRLQQSVFFRNVATLTAGTFLAQAFNVLFTPILSRLYSPSEFATFAIFTSLVAQVAVGASLRLEFALPTIADDNEANSLTKLAIRIVTIASLFSLVGVSVYIFLNNNYKENLLLSLAPVSIFLTAGIQILNYYSTRFQTFRLNSISRVSLSLVTGLLSSFFGWFGWGSTGLIVGTLAGQGIGAAVLWFPQKNRIIHTSSKTINVPHSYFFKKYRKFILINTPHAIIDTLELTGVLFLMNHFFTEKEIGSYFFAYRILKIPVTLIGSSVFQVFYQRMAEAKNSGRRITPMIRALYIRMALMGLPVFSILFFKSSEIFEIVFGQNWQLAGKLAGIMSPWLFLNFIASSVAGIIYIFSLQKTAFFITICDMTLRLSSILVVGQIVPFQTTILMLTVISSAIMIFGICWYYYVAYKNERPEATN